MVTALTSKKDTYTMMIIGTFVMASPTFILAFGPSFSHLNGLPIMMTIGEAMWQPRFLQWVAEIAPKNMTGIYMGIGQFPWFLNKSNYKSLFWLVFNELLSLRCITSGYEYRNDVVNLWFYCNHFTSWFISCQRLDEKGI